jgi:hypothetical protein
MSFINIRIARGERRGVYGVKPQPVLMRLHASRLSSRANWRNSGLNAHVLIGTG